jgi:hypothetical protein
MVRDVRQTREIISLLAVMHIHVVRSRNGTKLSRYFLPYQRNIISAHGTWFQIPRGTTCGCSAIRLLLLQVWIPSGAWIPVSYDYCVLSDTGFFVGLITHPEESYLVCCVWVWSWCLDIEEGLPPLGAVAKWGKILAHGKFTQTHTHTHTHTHTFFAVWSTQWQKLSFRIVCFPLSQLQIWGYK